jgi:hypothetical protein
MMNTTPQILTQRLLSPAFPFRQRAIGSDGLAFWISLQRQRLARDEVESVEEKTRAASMVRIILALRWEGQRASILTK